MFFAAASARAEIDYLRDVKPVLTQHCVLCHGVDKQEAGLRLDTAAALHAGGDSGPVIKQGAVEKSMLLQVVMGTHEDIPAMPYKKPPLSQDEIDRLTRWVLEGAGGPEQEEPGVYRHWAYVVPARPVPPDAGTDSWPRNDIDRFILDRLREASLRPAPEADRVTLIRRVSLDLTGLPPKSAEVDAFVRDTAPDAYERLVDRLLASPHYGERWGRHWLDVARYGDSNGYSIDAPRHMWKYRDWVVAALNRDLPFDQFVIEQLAGDLLPGATLEQRIATGFNRNTQINQEGGIDPEQFRIESVVDRVNTFGTAFLGLTVSCAQCHDHKFDQLSQREYFQLYAFFNNTVDDGHGDGRPGALLLFPDAEGPTDGLPARIAELREALAAHVEANGERAEAWRRGLTPEQRATLETDFLRSTVNVPFEKQTLNQRRALFRAMPEPDPEFEQLECEYTQLVEREKRAPSTLVMSELPEPRESFVFIKGDFTRRGETVSPGVPAALPPLRAERPNRLDLARWVVDPQHPLTARVTVNRIWQQYFGRGIVETENDFGTQGALPTHPELLDWLATEFVRGGWSLKALHRLIVTSATYRQSSYVRDDLELVDPLNRLLSRQARLRLDAEIIRDVGLAASGLLVPTLGGPPVYPPQPDGVMSLGQVRRTWTPSEGPDRYRRGLYTHIWRATPHPAMAVFDAADGFSSCTRRLRSNTPLQALTLLNDLQFYEFAEALAARIEAEGPPDVDGRIAFAFRLCVARPPTVEERERLAELHALEMADTEGDPAARARRAWITVARVLLNLDETITRE